MPRALLLTKDKKIPLLWQVLSVKYGKKIIFASHRDRKGKSSVSMGLEAGERDEAKVLIYPPGQTDYIRFEGSSISSHMPRVIG
jgi:protein disulfide-isomerase A6